MKNNFIVFFLILSLLFGCKPKLYKIVNSQNKLKVADSIFESGNLNLSLKLYKSVKKNDTNYNKFLFYKMASVYALKNKKTKAFNYIARGVAKDSSLWILEEPYFYNLIEEKKWKNIENSQLNKVEFKNGKFENRKLIKLTYKMFLKDQSYFYEIEHFQDKKKYHDLKNKINQENLLDLEKIISEYGWPTISKVGDELSETAFLIIQHQSNLEKQVQYLNLIEEAFKVNDVHSWNYAYLKDRVLIRENKKQIYGTQLSYDKIKNKTYFDVLNLENPDSVDNRRKTLNLEPISEYLDRMNIKWNPKGDNLYPE